MQRRTIARSLAAIGALFTLTGVAACAGTESSTAQGEEKAAEEAGGSQNYAELADLRTAIVDSGVDCGRIEESNNPKARAQGQCDFDGGQLVLQLWDDADARDDGTTDLITTLSGVNIEYCLILGRGDGGDGAWSINAGDDRQVCKDLNEALGGELFDGDANSSGGAASSSSSSRTTASRTPAPPVVAAPTVFEGTGDSVVQITKPAGATVVIASVTGNAAGRYFGVKAVDGDQDTLVNTTDPYTGDTLMDGGTGGTTMLQVTAVGPWKITLTDLRSAPRFTGAHSGTGDAVMIYEGSGRIAAITGNAAGRYFGVKAYGSSGSGGGIVNTTDTYTGTVPFPAGPVIVVVTAVDGWTISVS
jgi:hypothetical protein